MKIIIVGAGDLGLGLTEYLSNYDHEISVVERNPSLASDINSRYDVLTITGTGSSPDVLEQAGIEDADMLIAVTPSDEINLLACHFAMQYAVGKRIARIVSDEILGAGKIDLKTVGVTHVIGTEKELVKNVLRFIELPGLTDAADFHGESVYLRGYRVTQEMPIAGKTLYEMRGLAGDAPMLVMAIIREGQSLIPRGTERLIPGDEMIAIMPKDSYPAFRSLLNRPVKKLKKIVVAGNTLSAVQISDALSRAAERVILVDPDPEHARDAALALNRVEVLAGDLTDADLLQEVKVANADFFIAASKDMEDNIMSSLLARAEGAKEVIAIRTDDRHFDLFHSLGVDHVISPRRVTLQKIIESIQIAPIDPLLSLRKVDLAVVRAVASKKSFVLGKTLINLDKYFKKGIIIGAIVREGDIIIPDGHTEIQLNDEVLALCNKENLSTVKNIFKAGYRL
ncbi:Trk system potassium transporter TrkA [Chitinispirillales bacterium ANBcel5]|uniref:Trk system potassium transporter TrkA n=1 Tax=Cellulosispirillum alkaliphilum TaxID=3039283 RepID=UPI002A50AA55|nr:Trk system potassium transporter TrkA [Chitinispirillales bacterium ANBcel5]